MDRRESIDTEDLEEINKSHNENDDDNEEIENENDDDDSLVDGLYEEEKV